MKIRKYSVYLFTLALLVMILGAGQLSASESPKKPVASCKACHASIAQVLPKDHVPVPSASLGACLKCHPPAASGKPEKDVVFTRLHVAHSKAKIACTTCHVYKAGGTFGLIGTNVSIGKPSREEMTLLERTMGSWSGSPHLDAIHAKNNIGCAACHGKQLPEKGDDVTNERCSACHGSYEAIAAKTVSAKFSKRNPHKSHLGEIGCTVCHQAHGQSNAYCNGCHSKFDMKIPGGN